MTSNYYRLLESGELGYTPAAEFSAYPQLFGLTIPDDHADESFTVYDHPRAIIYRNTGRLSPELLRARLERYLPRSTVTGYGSQVEGGLSSLEPSTSGRSPGHARYLPQATVEGSGFKVEGGLSDSQLSTFNLQPSTSNQSPVAPLTLDQPVDTLPVVADFRWNRLASESPIVATLLWWLALSVMGWAVWPLLFPLLGGLQDRGYGLARTAGWLLVGWVHWMAVSIGLWQNRLAPLALICAGLILAGTGAWWIQRRRIGAFWAARRRLLLGEEGLFALAFLAFVGIRILNPDLWQPWNGGEKFMESAFLNAVLRSPHFPPYDPYFAGGSLNYYYFGLYLVSIPIKLTGIAPEVAYNLAVPALFALTAVGIFSVGHTLADGGRPTTDDGRRTTDDGRRTDDGRYSSPAGDSRSAIGCVGAADGQSRCAQPVCRTARQSAGPIARARIRLLGIEPGHSADHQRVPVLDLPVRRSPSASHRDAVRDTGGRAGGELGAGSWRLEVGGWRPEGRGWKWTKPPVTPCFLVYLSPHPRSRRDGRDQHLGSADLLPAGGGRAADRGVAQPARLDHPGFARVDLPGSARPH